MQAFFLMSDRHQRFGAGPSQNISETAAFTGCSRSAGAELTRDGLRKERWGTDDTDMRGQGVVMHVGAKADHQTRTGHCGGKRKLAEATCLDKTASSSSTRYVINCVTAANMYTS